MDFIIFPSVLKTKSGGMSRESGCNLLSNLCNPKKTNFDSNKVMSAHRPFAFIDFDAVIERNRKKLNKKIFEIVSEDLQTLEDELKAHPPQIVDDKAIRLDIGRKEGQNLFSQKFHKTK